MFKNISVYLASTECTTKKVGSYQLAEKTKTLLTANYKLPT